MNKYNKIDYTNIELPEELLTSFAKALAPEIRKFYDSDEDYVCEMPLDDFNKRRAIINIFVHSIYLYDDHFTLIINASKKPLSIDNIPLKEIEEAFEGENTETDECSSLTSSVPPKKHDGFDTDGIATIVLFSVFKELLNMRKIAFPNINCSRIL